jgi:hypothetical protein
VRNVRKVLFPLLKDQGWEKKSASLFIGTRGLAMEARSEERIDFSVSSGKSGGSEESGKKVSKKGIGEDCQGEEG